MKITDQMIENAATSAWYAAHGHNDWWERQSPAAQAAWRYIARQALLGALEDALYSTDRETHHG